jgi:hypothetical protein
VGGSTLVADPASSKSAPSLKQPIPWHRRPIPPLVLIAGVLSPICIFTFLLLQQVRFASTHSGGPAPGRLTVESRPDGAEVLVDGQGRGTTPLTMSLDAGRHTMTLRHDGEERTVPMQMAAGAEIQHYFDFTVSNPADPARTNSADPTRMNSPVPPRGTSATPVRTTMSVVTDPPKAQVPKVSTPPATGWLKVEAPFEVEILERSDRLGTSGASKTMLPAGRHQISLVNQTLGYRDSRIAEVASAKTTTLRVEAPKAIVSVNAKPWADVSIDGKPAGETPIANVEVPIGSHEVVFRHPQLGERRQTVVVTTQGPNRISADLTK